MKQAAAHTTTKSPSVDTAFTATSVATAFLDTTWRIATPVILCTVLGIIADRHFGSKPWVTLLAVVVGFGLATLLVKRQIAKIQKTEGGS